MSTTIFTYSGTGNTLWIARELAKRLDFCEVISMSGFEKKPRKIDPERIGLAFPVYMWGVPAPVIRFLSRLPELNPDYLFALASNGGQVANTLIQLRNLCAERNLILNSAYSFPMPSNYIPWGGPGPREKQEQRFEAAREKIAGIADTIREKKNGPVEKGPLWQRILLTGMYRMSAPHVPEMDKRFRADEKCNGCGICARVCPAENITMENGKPSWHHRCEQCFACLQWCPEEALQYGRKTPKYARYHHPEITLKDILKS